MKKNNYLALLILLIAVVFLSGCSTNESATKQTDEPYAENSDQPANSSVGSSDRAVSDETVGGENNPNPMIIDQKKTYTAVLRTDTGDIEIALNASLTPITVNNFVSLAKKNFYDNTIFHRAVKGFMIQGGDPRGDGTGGPGYRFDDEPFDGEYLRGTVAMANSGPDTNGSQFFIMHKDYPLSKDYVIFGQVTKGLETVDKIAEAPVESSPSGEMSKPVKPIAVKSVEIVEK
jgi:cyclophilin family peptidyl-prolyl cis-trans isomerase